MGRVRRIVLDLCGGTGAWAEWYRRNGYDVRNITLPEHNVCIYQPPRRVHGILAAPVCRDMSFVLSEKLPRDIKSAMKVVNGCRRIIRKCKRNGGLKWWALENPVGHLSKYIGEPRFIFQPWEFGDPWTKRTAIWGEFELPKKTFKSWDKVKKNPKLYIRPGRGKPNMVWLHKSAIHDIPKFRKFTVEDDAGFRAITPQGFARAFFKANP